MKKNIVVCVGVLLALLLAASWAEATILLNHQGATNPSTEGWGSLGFNYSWDSQIPTVGPVTGDQGYDAWQMNTMSRQEFYAYYEVSTAGMIPAMQANGWRMTAVLRVADDYQPGVPDYASTVWLKAGYSYGLRFGLDATKTDTVVTTISGNNYTVPGTGYHSYVLLDADKDTNADFYIDGVWKETLNGGATGGDNRFDIGDLSSSGDCADTRYNMVKLETVPEPATLSLLVMAIVGLLLRKRR